MEHHTTEYNMFTHLLSGPKIACQVSLHSTKTTSQVQTFPANYAVVPSTPLKALQSPQEKQEHMTMDSTIIAKDFCNLVPHVSSMAQRH
jgi:hypothetical protein